LAAVYTVFISPVCLDAIPVGPRTLTSYHYSFGTVCNLFLPNYRLVTFSASYR